jgi:hypothetical protein
MAPCRLIDENSRSKFQNVRADSWAGHLCQPKDKPFKHGSTERRLTMLIVFILIFNGGISWSNAYVCGKSWVETRALGGFPRVMVWCGAIQSAIGFSSLTGFLMGWIAFSVGKIPQQTQHQAESLWYVTIILPAIGTGLLITIESWRITLRDRSLMNLSTSAWNTFAEFHNTYNAIQDMGGAWKASAKYLAISSVATATAMTRKPNWR